MARGLVFRWLDEPGGAEGEPAQWPGVTILIPAFNEQAVIATSVGAALDVDYPRLEVLVLDDGSLDDTAGAAARAAGGDARCRVVRDLVNRGKADRLNQGLRLAAHELVLVSDADTHVHPQAPKRLVSRMLRSSQIAAVAGAPHVTNRDHFLCTMQIPKRLLDHWLDPSNQSLTGRVGTVAGVLALVRRERVLAVGDYDPRMATEDIELTWKRLLAGWSTAYEPYALIGRQVPATLPSLWQQRNAGPVARARSCARTLPRRFAGATVASGWWRSRRPRH